MTHELVGAQISGSSVHGLSGRVCESTKIYITCKKTDCVLYLLLLYA